MMGGICGLTLSVSLPPPPTPLFLSLSLSSLSLLGRYYGYTHIYADNCARNSECCHERHPYCDGSKDGAADQSP